MEFKVGDKVRVVRKVVQEDGWDNCWFDGSDTGMSQWINNGREYTILEIRETGVVFSENREYGWPKGALELVDVPEMERHYPLRELAMKEQIIGRMV